MQYRDKRTTPEPAPRPRRRTTRRGLAPLGDADTEPSQVTAPLTLEEDDEPAVSSRPTRRDFAAPDLALLGAAAPSRKGGPRGEYSVSSARGIQTDVVSGAIERRVDDVAQPRRRRTTSMPAENVYLASATKREITVIIKDQALTLDRHDALALAQIIVTTFD